MPIGSHVFLRASKILIATAALMLAAHARAPSALAQGSDYKALTEAAVEEHTLGHYDEARALFARAHALNPNARTFWGMGVAAFEARQYVDAVRLLTQARDDTRKPLTAEQRKRTDSLLERAESFVVRLPIRVEPASAKLTIDGRAAEPDTHGVVSLDAGAHQIVISAPGYEDISRLLRWEAGNASVLDVHLQKKGSAQPPEAVAATQETATDANPSAPADTTAGPNSFTVLKWVSLGATVASLGVVGAGIALRESEAAHYNDDAKCPPPDRDLACPDSRQTVKKMERMAIAGGVAAGVFATLSVVFFLLDRKPQNHSASESTRCGPAFEGGALCQVRF